MRNRIRRIRMEEVVTNGMDGGMEGGGVDLKAARKQFSRLGLMFILGTIVIYAVQIVPTVIVSLVKPTWLWNGDISALLSMVPMYLIGMPALILLVKRIPADHVERHEMKPGSFILAAIMCFALMYVFNIIGNFMTTIIGLLKGDIVQNTIQNVANSMSLWLILVYMVICAPFMEEYIFRKLIVDRTVHYGQGVAVLMSGLMFGLFHGNLNQFVYAFALGVFLAFLYVRTGNLKITIALHMMINFMGGFVSSLLTRLIDLEEYTYVSSYGGQDEIMEFVMDNLLGMIGLAGLGFFVIGVTLAGVILLIVFLAMGKFKFGRGAVTLPRGKKFSTMFLNVGMGTYCVFWIVMIVIQLFQ